MSPTVFPLRWESTGDQWWYVSPIDWAVANGLYDLVRHLLHLDTNLLIKLTSLRRIRRLETLWDDDVEQFPGVAKCRSHVAQKLLHSCQNKLEGGHHQNSLIRAGYGGWLLYTATSAGDMEFIKELIKIDPLLVFGEGEYGVTDILYAASRSKNCEVFRFLFELCNNNNNNNNGGEGEGEGEGDHHQIKNFKWEMKNRAIHGLARGGNLEMLKELLLLLGQDQDINSSVLIYKDFQESTILHTAAARGQVEVVKYLLASYDEILAVQDNQGNTALHVAAYRGYLPVVQALLLASPSSSYVISLTNVYGHTFLHTAIASFQSPGFRRLDLQIDLVKILICENIFEIKDIMNAKNNQGRTVLHMAAIHENINSDLVELLMSIPSIQMNVRDNYGMTPLDLLKQRPRSASSEILIKRFISSGGSFNGQDLISRNAFCSQLKMHGSIMRSPGTSFRVPDAEMFLYTCTDDNASEFSVCSSSEISWYENKSLENKNLGSVNINNTAKRLKILLKWARKKEQNKSKIENDDNDRNDLLKSRCNGESIPISLREIYSDTNSKDDESKKEEMLSNRRRRRGYLCFGANRYIQ